MPTPEEKTRKRLIVLGAGLTFTLVVLAAAGWVILG